MVADTKRCQTFINVVAEEMARIRVAMDKITEYRAKFQTANPSVAGTPLSGNVAALNNAYVGLKNEVDKVIWTELIAAQAMTHRNNAL